MSSRQGMSLRILRDMCGIYATARSLGPNDEVIVAVVELSAGEGTVDVEVSGPAGDATLVLEVDVSAAVSLL